MLDPHEYGEPDAGVDDGEALDRTELETATEFHAGPLEIGAVDAHGEAAVLDAGTNEPEFDIWALETGTLDDTALESIGVEPGANDSRPLEARVLEIPPLEGHGLGPGTFD